MCIGIWIQIGKSNTHGFDLGVGLTDGHVFVQTADPVEPMTAPIVFIFQRVGLPNLNVGRAHPGSGELKVGRHDAYDRGVPTIDACGITQKIRVAPKRLLPQVVADDRDGWRTLQVIVRLK